MRYKLEIDKEESSLWISGLAEGADKVNDKKYFFMPEENIFSKDKFLAPPRSNAPMYNWVWNAPVSRVETDSQLAEMQRLGIRAVCIIPEPKSFRPTRIPTTMAPDYLSPSYFEEYRYTVEKAKELGMKLWLYDEGGWPSGSADGRVLQKHPELAKMSLASRRKKYAAGSVYTAAEDTAAACLADGAEIQTGFVFAEDTEVTEYYARRSCFEEPGIPDYPDMTRKESTEVFLEMTHEAYKPYLQEFFGDTVTAVFSDEPSAPRPVPFREEIEAEFEKRTGYSIRPFLPELLGEREVTEAGARARIVWFDICSTLFCKNYLLLEKAWSNQNGMAFTGHLDNDHAALECMLNGGNYHLLRCLRCFDVPGIDVIWRQIYHRETPNPFNYQTGVNGIFPRFASSAAAQIGTQRALTESFGVYGAGLTYEEMRYIMNFQAVRGINVFNIFGIPYGREGFQMTGELPFFTEKHACYADLAPFNQYLERLSYVASLGKNAADTALYMPMCDFWAGGERAGVYADAFERAGDELESVQVPFDIFDDDVMESAEPAALAEGVLAMGQTRYTALVIPKCKYMPASTAEKLSRFAAGGGRVFLLSGYAGPEIPGAVRVENAKNILAAPLHITGDTEKIRLGERRAENGRLFLIYNEAADSSAIFVHTKEAFCVLDLEKGKLVRPNRTEDGMAFTVGCGDMVCLWLGEDSETAEDAPVFTKEMSLEGEYTFRRSSRFRIGEMHFETEMFSEDAKPIELGDWSETVGIDYSGSGIYKTRFAAPKTEGKVLLDLGEVHYSCEAFLNGQTLGIRVMAPYSFEIPAEMLQAENELEIRVANTAANEYLHTKSFEKWSPWQLTVYQRRQRLFHEDSQTGGLYGPVRILY